MEEAKTVVVVVAVGSEVVTGSWVEVKEMVEVTCPPRAVYQCTLHCAQAFLRIEAICSNTDKTMHNYPLVELRVFVMANAHVAPMIQHL